MQVTNMQESKKKNKKIKKKIVRGNECKGIKIIIKIYINIKTYTKTFLSSAWYNEYHSNTIVLK
jgi:hypothetical protein